MLTFIGVLVIVAAIGGFVWNQVKKVQDVKDKQNVLYNETQKDRYYHKPVRNLPIFPLGSPLILTIAGIFIITLNGMFFWANSGTAYAVQYPWGGDKMIKTQGLKTKMWGRTIPLSFEISIQDKILPVDSNGDKGKLGNNQDGIYNREAKLWEFSDAIKAEIGTAVVVGVSTDDEELFLDMADRNRSESKLIYGRVLPNIDAAIKNTCKLMDAQEYISGKSSDFDRYFRDQLENGMYLVEEYYEEERIPEIIGDTSTIRTIKPQRSSKQKRFRIKTDEQGNIVRDNKSNTLKQYGITIYQAQVTSIDWETSFDDRLDEQKKEVAQTQLEKQQAERQFYTAKKEVAKGEAEKAKERALLEKEQIKLTIAAETEAKVAEQNVIAEKKKLEVAKLQAQSKKVSADAQYYENSKLVSAGLTPQERATLELEKATAVAREFSKMAVPQVVIMGQEGKSGGSLTNSLIQAEMAKNLINKSN